MNVSHKVITIGSGPRCLFFQVDATGFAVTTSLKVTDEGEFHSVARRDYCTVPGSLVYPRSSLFPQPQKKPVLKVVN